MTDELFPDELYRNEAEVRLPHSTFRDLIKRALCLPESYNVWGFWDMGDYISVLVESADLPPVRADEYLPLLTLHLKQEKNGALRLHELVIDKEWYAASSRRSTGESEAI